MVCLLRWRCTNEQCQGKGAVRTRSGAGLQPPGAHGFRVRLAVCWSALLRQDAAALTFLLEFLRIEHLELDAAIHRHALDGLVRGYRQRFAIPLRGVLL